MEPGVLAERDQVAQQPGTVDARAAVGEAHAGPVRLAGDRAVGLEQVRAQGFVGDVVGVGSQELRPRRVVGVAVEIGRAPSELQSLMRISYAVFCLKKKNTQK